MKREGIEDVYFAGLGAQGKEKRKAKTRRKHKSRSMVISEDIFRLDTPAEFNLDDVKNMILTAEDLEFDDNDAASENEVNLSAADVDVLANRAKELLADLDLRPNRLRLQNTPQSVSHNGKLIALIKGVCSAPPSQRKEALMEIHQDYGYADFLNLTHADKSSNIIMYEALQKSRDYLDLELDPITVTTPLHYYEENDRNNLIKEESYANLVYFNNVQSLTKHIFHGNVEFVFKFSDGMRKCQSNHPSMMIKNVRLFRLRGGLVVMLYYTKLMRGNQQRYFIDTVRMYLWMRLCVNK